jgi:hypothetical protein
MKITQRIFGVDMKKIPFRCDSGNMMSNKAGLLHSNKALFYCLGEGKSLADDDNSVKRIKRTQRTVL